MVKSIDSCYTTYDYQQCFSISEVAGDWGTRQWYGSAYYAVVIQYPR